MRCPPPRSEGEREGVYCLQNHKPHGTVGFVLSPPIEDAYRDWRVERERQAAIALRAATSTTSVAVKRNGTA